MLVCPEADPIERERDTLRCEFVVELARFALEKSVREAGDQLDVFPLEIDEVRLAGERAVHDERVVRAERGMRKQVLGAKRGLHFPNIYRRF